ncbi:UNVERIFIED_CONTAM: transmembrane protein [Trichonephila clavipes]
MIPLRINCLKRLMQIKYFEVQNPQIFYEFLVNIVFIINYYIFITILSSMKYKEEYERFKLTVTVIILILSAQSIIFSYRALDAILHFLLVWYYCTLTIRESILVVNGSR